MTALPSPESAFSFDLGDRDETAGLMRRSLQEVETRLVFIAFRREAHADEGEDGSDNPKSGEGEKDSSQHDAEFNRSRTRRT